MIMKLCICLKSCLSLRFMSIVLWPGMTHLVPRLSQNACCGRGGPDGTLSVLRWFFNRYQFSSLNWHRYIISVTQLCPAPYDPMDHSTPGLPVFHQLPEFIQTHDPLVGDVIQSSHPLSSPAPPTFNLSQHQDLLNESALRIRWTKYCSFSLNISPSNEHSGLISFRMDWLDLLAVKGTLKSLLQYHSSKASILRCSAFFILQLSHPYLTTGKNIALTRWTFVGKVMSLLFNMLSRLVITFLPRSKHLLISWLQSPSAVI